MRGNFNACPSFANSHSHPQQPQPPFGNGYNPNIPQQTTISADVDLSVHIAQQIVTLQAKPDEKLGLELIGQRLGLRGRLNLANEVFGFDSWSSSITSLAIDYVCSDKNPMRIRWLADLASF